MGRHPIYGKMDTQKLLNVPLYCTERHEGNHQAARSDGIDVLDEPRGFPQELGPSVPEAVHCPFGSLRGETKGAKT